MQIALESICLLLCSYLLCSSLSVQKWNENKSFKEPATISFILIYFWQILCSLLKATTRLKFFGVYLFVYFSGDHSLSYFGGLLPSVVVNDTGSTCGVLWCRVESHCTLLVALKMRPPPPSATEKGWGIVRDHFELCLLFIAPLTSKYQSCRHHSWRSAHGAPKQSELRTSSGKLRPEDGNQVTAACCLDSAEEGIFMEKAKWMIWRAAKVSHGVSTAVQCGRSQTLHANTRPRSCCCHLINIKGKRACGPE